MFSVSMAVRDVIRTLRAGPSPCILYQNGVFRNQMYGHTFGLPL